jgi:hypothetical protein
MKPLSIVAYFDGRLGHEKQTRAILNALSDMTSIHVESIEVSVTPATYFKNLAAYFFSFLVPARPISKAHSVDLFIGTGTHTHIPMILDKKSRSRLSDHQMRVVTLNLRPGKMCLSHRGRPVLSCLRIDITLQED